MPLRGKVRLPVADSVDPVAALERAVVARPGDIETRLRLAFALLDTGRFQAARAVLLSVQRQNPRSFPALLGLSKAARGLGDTKKSLLLAREAALLDPREVGVRLDIGFDLMRLEQFAAAEAAFRTVLESEPAHVGALVGLGHLARRRGDRAEALGRFQAVLAADPDHFEATLEIAGELAEAGEGKAALPLVEALLRRDPTNLNALMQRGNLARSAGDHATAEITFAQARDAYPNFYPAAVALAETQRAQGRPGDSAHTLRGVLAADPNDLHALLSLADQAWLAQNYDLCLTLSLRAARAHPAHVMPPLQATRALMELGRGGDAIALLDPIGAANGWPQALVARKAEILQANGEWEAAVALLNSVVEPPEFVVWLQRVRLHLALGTFTEAEAALATAPARGPAELGFVGLMGGQIAEAKWQLTSARDRYRAALAGNPNAAGVHAELARVSLLLCDLDACRTHTAASLELNASVHKLRGQSLNPSSTHVGQIWDEFRMDAARAARLRALLGQPAFARIAPMLAMVRELGDHTPTAMLLMVALRQSGQLSIAADPDPARPIPRRIVQYWDEEEPPPEIAAMIEGWSERHPDYEHLRFNLNAAGHYLQDNFPAPVVQAFIRATLAAQKADIFRLAYLAREGGVYVDADDRCLSHVSSVLPQGASLVAWQEHFGTLGNNFLAAGPGHPVIVRALELGVAAMNRGDEDIPWLATGPGLLTRAFAQILAEAPDLGSGLRGCVVLEGFETSRLALFHQFSEYKRTSKHWLRASFGAVQPVDSDTSPDVLQAAM